MKPLVWIFGVLLLVGCGFATGYSYCRQTIRPEVREMLVVKVPDAYYNHWKEPAIDAETALTYLRAMRFSHEVWKDRILNGYVSSETIIDYGGVGWQDECIAKYDQLIDLVGKLSDLERLSARWNKQ